MTHFPDLQSPEVIDGFDPHDRKWYVLGCKVFADVPVSTAGTAHDPWQIAGETSDAPTGTNDETGFSEYANVAAFEPGHVWPFMNLGATLMSVGQSAPSVISKGGYYPAAQALENINHYRRCFRLAPRMFGSAGRRIIIDVPIRIKATNAANCVDVIIHHDLVTATPTTTFTAGKYTGFRWIVGNLGANEVAGTLHIEGHAMGAFKQIWSARLTVAAQTNPEITAPAIDAQRGPTYVNLSATGPNMDTVGSLVAVLFAARRTTACTFDQIGTAGTACVQDGSEVYVKAGAGLALLSPGH